jgi:undecaprenyl-diphosphatase
MVSFSIYNFLYTPAATSFFVFITDYTLGYMVGPLVVLLFIFYKKDMKMILYFITSFILLTIIRFGLSELIHRARPFVDNASIQFLGHNHTVNGYSFPSGHSTQSFFLVYFLTTYLKTNKWITVSLYLLALLVALSRVYLGAHYVLDVLAGGLLGLLWGHASFKVLRTLRP